MTRKHTGKWPRQSEHVGHPLWRKPIPRLHYTRTARRPCRTCLICRCDWLRVIFSSCSLVSTNLESHICIHRTQSRSTARPLTAKTLFCVFWPGGCLLSIRKKKVVCVWIWLHNYIRVIFQCVPMRTSKNIWSNKINRKAQSVLLKDHKRITWMWTYWNPNKKASDSAFLRAVTEQQREIKVMYMAYTQGHFKVI